MRSALITVSLLDIQGRDIRPWLKEMGIKFVVRQDRVDLVSFPPSVELRYFGRWPVLYSTDHFLEGNPELGYDVIADIDPDEFEIDIRPHWWFGEEDDV